MASFDEIGKAVDAVAAIVAGGIIPAGLEMMDRPMIAAVEHTALAATTSRRRDPAVRIDGSPEEGGGGRSTACRRC